MVVAAALFGALSPFGSCGVIPLIATRRAMGAPLAPVMAFWLASPVMDPSMSPLVGGDGPGPIALAMMVGAPACLNGCAAPPRVAGLVVEQGMARGAGLAFLVAGGVSPIPAAAAVWAFARREAFALRLGFAFAGSMAAGRLFQALG